MRVHLLVKAFKIIRSNNYRRRKLLAGLLLGLCGLAVVYRLRNYKTRSTGRTRNKNYFLQLDNISTMGLVINTSSCRIPNFSPWDSSVARLMKKNFTGMSCAKEDYTWSSLVGSELVMNKTQMYRLGYSLDWNLFCCYKSIERVEQSLSNFTWNADNLFKWSLCVNIKEERTVVEGAEFIHVECRGGMDLEVVYKGYHGSALTKDITKTGEKGKRPRKPSLLNKVNHWKDKKEELLRDKGLAEEFQLPPSILVIGQDSTSRLNFRRNMIKTRAVLESLGAVEMLGYIKVGGNTFPNICPMLTGYPAEDIKRLCHQDNFKPVDNCPFIFRRFDEANYLTAFIEDAPFYAIFNYKRTGFVHQPVDFYSRPLFLDVVDYVDPDVSIPKPRSAVCIGSQTNDEVIIRYLESVLDFAHQHSSPFFALSWSTYTTHDSYNYGQILDTTTAEFLQRIEDKGYLNNTILIIMGDHGSRFGPIRETLVGYFEDRMPNMWIRLPPKLREKYPEWQKALKINSARVTSPHVLYWTLQTLLVEFTPVNRPVVDEMTPEGERIPRPPGNFTFFKEIPEAASCEDMAIPDIFCPCYPLKKINVEDSILRKAAEHAVGYINSNILNGTQCEKLSLTNVTAGGYMNKTKIGLNGETKRVGRYIVGFNVKPGSLPIEADVEYFHGNSSFSALPTVQRVSKIDRDQVKCIQDSKQVELFCICPS